MLAAVVRADLLATRSAWRVEAGAARRGRTRRACGLPPLGLALRRPERDALQPAPAARKDGLEGSGVLQAALLAWLGVAMERQPKVRRGRARAA